jgi:hypothetical protein
LSAGVPVTRVDGFEVSEPGVGVQANLRLFHWARVRFSLDSELDYFPGIHSYPEEQKRFVYWPAAEEVSKSQLLAGLRAGLSWRGAELFGKFRPGMFRFSDFTQYREGAGWPAVWPIPEGAHENRPKLRPALDLGGGVVLPIGRRCFLRMDAGDVLVHYDRDLFSVPNIGHLTVPPLNHLPVRRREPLTSDDYLTGEWRHHFQIGACFGVRF